MKKLVIPPMFVLAFAAYGGFWDTLNKVQRTVDTVNAVGEIINGKPAQTQQPAQAQPAESAATPVSTSPATVSAAPFDTADAVAAHAPGSVFTQGEPLRFSLKPYKVHLFAADTEERIYFGSQKPLGNKLQA